MDARRCSTSRRDPNGLADALDRASAIRPCGHGSAPRRVSARVRDYSWGAHCEALERAAPRPMGARDTYEVAASSPTRFRRSAAAAAGAPTSWRGDCARAVTPSLVVQPRPGTAETVRETAYDEFRGAWSSAPRAPALPYVRNYFKNERLYARLARVPDAVDRPRADRHRPWPARDDVPAVDRGGAPGRRAGRSARCATTGRSATGRT